MQHSIIAILTAGVITISSVMVPAQADSRDYRRDSHRDSQQERRYDKRGDSRNERRHDKRGDSRNERRHDKRGDSRNERRHDKRGDSQRERRYDKRGDSRNERRHDKRGDSRNVHRDEKRGDYRKHGKSRHVKRPIIYRGHGDSRSHGIPSHRIRRHRNIVIVRPYGHLYQGYGHYYHDDDAYKWLAFTAIAVKLLDNLNEQQERAHEAAQVRATTAPIGETIYWSDGNASGYVAATREGTSSAGRYCREFQHEVTIGTRREQAYGTACRAPDGSWELISTGQ